MYTDNMLVGSWSGANYTEDAGTFTIGVEGYITQSVVFLTPVMSLENYLHILISCTSTVAKNVFLHIKFHYFDTHDVSSYPINESPFSAKLPFDGSKILSGFTISVYNHSAAPITTAALSVLLAQGGGDLAAHMADENPHNLPLAITVGQWGIKGTKGESVSFWLKDTGDLQLAGDINMTSGSINWSLVNNPPASDLPAYIQSTYIDFANIASPNIYGGTMEVGGTRFGMPANEFFKISNLGIQLGNTNFVTAPFAVDMEGNLWAENAVISGNIFGSTVTGSTIYVYDQDGAAPGTVGHGRIQIGGSSLDPLSAENNLSSIVYSTFTNEEVLHGLQLTGGWADVEFWLWGSKMLTIGNLGGPGMGIFAEHALALGGGYAPVPTEDIILLESVTKVNIFKDPRPAEVQVRNIHVSTSAPTSQDGTNGDVWIQITS